MKNVTYKLLLTEDDLSTLKTAVENALALHCPPSTSILDQDNVLAGAHPNSHIGKLLMIKEALRRAFHGSHSSMIEVSRG